MSSITFRNIKKQYDNASTPTIENLNLEIEEGEFIAFVGPSGCGKTTTIRMLAGLETVTDGDIIIGEKRVNEIMPRNRDIAMVFQNYALYPHKTVYKNISFGLKMKKIPKDEIEKRVNWAASILNISDQLEKKPKDLSGGQRQRVALARAIVKDCGVFLMDEPLSNLDAKLRVTTRTEITNLHKQLKSTFIYVTHDQVEAMTMADRIVVMNKGEVMQVGTPKDLYQNPDNLFVATFIGTPQMNILEARVKNEYLIFNDSQKILIPNHLIESLESYQEKMVYLGIRPEDLSTSNMELSTYGDNVLNLKCNVSELIGKNYYIHTEINSLPVIVDTTDEIEDDANFKVVFKPHKIYMFDIETKVRIR